MIDSIDLKAALVKEFGFTTFRPGQAEVIEAILMAKSALAVLPTGGGKTLIYQMLGRLRPGLTIIVTPLLSLMQDQVARLNYLGETRAVALNSALVGQERQLVISQLNHYRFLFISPEMLSQAPVLKRLKQLTINLFVIDEAHTIISWGPDFRPEYLKLPAIHQQLQRPQLLLLTATATPKMLTAVQEIFTLKEQESWFVYQQAADRPNIHLHTEQFVDEDSKRTRLLTLIRQLAGPGIIYVSSRRLANQLAAALQATGKTGVMAYHAGMDYLTRYKIQQQFMLGKLNLIVATSAFGMGIDKADIRYVIHYQLSADLPNYLQEFGRAGRDGQAALAILLYAAGDEYLQKNLIERSLPSTQQLELIYTDKVDLKQLDPQLVRVVTSYQEQGYDLAQTALIFEKRRIEKLQALKEMVDYAKATMNLRQTLLKTFSQVDLSKLSATNESSGSQSEALAKFLLAQPDKIGPNPQSKLNWSVKMAKLFNLD
ncbi:ATP-dependent DNA helicase RecQ [Weissella oryzae SG25]|uniref:ATP-dependent DNA helicase RecQ n=1 Tax=Weissella oryzae (strain DSM 25784 / JCM 18191 / LMG 30913 / SG25) TaxID=1329250 RepID=A0A069CRP0_WEIOS|nr:RecQ family ATP-dependent DNA helicase [Weissella oryzae]GAK30440.1 ATP-dependent DNA helicase RecQ [Weissella oryzae SG25]